MAVCGASTRLSYCLPPLQIPQATPLRGEGRELGGFPSGAQEGQAQRLEGHPG